MHTVDEQVEAKHKHRETMYFTPITVSNNYRFVLIQLSNQDHCFKIEISVL